MPTLNACTSQHNTQLSANRTALIAQEWHLEKALRSFYFA